LQISPLELLIMIIEFEPNLEDEPEDGIKWSKGFKDFIKVCLTKEGRERPSPRQMLEHPWLKKMMEKNVRMDKLVEFCWGE
jgi:mitogen-activated protein kinase kinase